jgi:hypothetical protein
VRVIGDHSHRSGLEARDWSGESSQNTYWDRGRDLLAGELLGAVAGRRCRRWCRGAGDGGQRVLWGAARSWTMPPLTRWQSPTTTSPPARSMAEAIFFATLRDASTLSFQQPHVPSMPVHDC